LHYFAMEFVEGMDLARYVERVGPLPVEEACEYMRQVAQGLQHAHQSGLVHRDVKPANLFLLHPPAPGERGAARRGPDPVVKVLDWGLARCLRDGGGGARGSTGDSEQGVLVGTADYIAPEQARDPRLVDIRADIYSLGCTFYFLLTGKAPFPARSLMQKLHAHQEEDPPSLRAARPDVPEELDAMCRKMLEKVPDYRYQIPLLIVSILRRYCVSPALARQGASWQGAVRPSSAILSRPGSVPALPAPGLAPGTHTSLPRPSTNPTLSRPNTTPNLPRPGLNDPPRR
jgi:serine/threonine protein kinase